MEFDITTRGKVSVGPNGLARNVPRSVRIVVTDKDPYDLDIRLVWDDDEQRLVPDDLRVTRRPDGIPVRAADLGRIKIGQLIEHNLTAEILDSRGWAGIIEDHARRRPGGGRRVDLRRWRTPSVGTTRPRRWRSPATCNPVRRSSG